MLSLAERKYHWKNKWLRAAAGTCTSVAASRPPTSISGTQSSFTDLGVLPLFCTPWVQWVRKCHIECYYREVFIFFRWHLGKRANEKEHQRGLKMTHLSNLSSFHQWWPHYSPNLPVQKVIFDCILALPCPVSWVPTGVMGRMWQIWMLSWAFTSVITKMAKAICYCYFFMLFFDCFLKSEQT